ncbi:hypothetical protein [Proteiniborus sp.]|uniref:hypothetical protein n=1 Tax=Proteiniborus sp. TaxID=2079015 RepID=UPI003322FE14
MSNSKNSSKNPFCNIEPVQLTLIGAFLTLAGDFLSFLATFSEAQNACQNKNDNQKQSQLDANIIYAENKIKELEYEISKLKKEIKDFS